MTRPDERIDVVLDTLKELWRHHPDQRLGQLLLNTLRYGTGEWPDDPQDLVDLIWEKEDTDWYARFWYQTNAAIHREVEIDRIVRGDLTPPTS